MKFDIRWFNPFVYIWLTYYLVARLLISSIDLAQEVLGFENEK